MRFLWLTAWFRTYTLAYCGVQQPLPELFPPADDEALKDPEANEIATEPGFKQATIRRINTAAILNAKEPTISLA
jgi:hypothetical protein